MQHKKYIQEEILRQYIKKKCYLNKKFPKMYILGLVVHAAADGVALGAAATTNQGARSTIKYNSSFYRSHTWNATIDKDRHSTNSSHETSIPRGSGFHTVHNTARSAGVCFKLRFWHIFRSYIE